MKKTVLEQYILKNYSILKLDQLNLKKNVERFLKNLKYNLVFKKIKTDLIHFEFTFKKSQILSGEFLHFKK